MPELAERKKKALPLLIRPGSLLSTSFSSYSILTCSKHWGLHRLSWGVMNGKMKAYLKETLNLRPRLTAL
jgi:hypothetical protein